MKKLLASLLCVMMVFCMMPGLAWADVTPTDVAKIGDIGYASLAAAIAAAGDGETVILLEDVTDTDTIRIESGRTVSLDLNNHSVGFAFQKFFRVCGGTLNLTGTGSVYEQIPYFGPVVVKGSTTDVANYSVVNVGESVTLEGWAGLFLDNNKVDGNNYGYGMVANVNGTLIGRNDGSDDGYGLYLNGNIVHSTGNVPQINIGSTAKISGAQTAWAIYLAGFAQTTIADGAMIQGKNTGIEIRAGELTVNGGTICGNGALATSSSNGNGTTTDGAGIAIAQHTTKLPITVTVNDGNISGYFALYESNPQNNSTEDIAKVSIDVKGGNFSAINGGTSAVYSENKTEFIAGGRFSSDACEYKVDGKYCSKESSAADAMYLVHDHNTTCNFGHTYCPATCEGEGICHTLSHYVPTVPTTPTTPTDNVTNSGTAGADNATTSADLSGTTSTSGGTTTATVDKETADKIVDKAVENKSEEVVIDATANTTTAADSTVIAQVGIPTATLEAIAEKTDADVTVKTDVAEVKMDNATAGAVAEQAAGDTVQIIVEKVDETADKVEFELKVVCSQGNVIRDFKGGNVAVTVAVPKAMAEKEIVCVYIDDNGRISKVKGQKNADGTYTFITGHFSTYALMTAEEADTAIEAQKEAIQNTKITLRSQQVKMKNGKKAIKLTWTADSDVDFDGVEIYRSTKRHSGFVKEPFFETTKDAYYNTAIKTGTKYYYKVKAYVEVEGEKIYTDYSTKAWRTVK